MSIAAITEADNANHDIEWAELPSGPELGSMISAADLAGLSDDELVDVLGAVRRQISGLQAVELAGVAALARRREAEAETSGAVGTQVGEYMSDEVGLALTVSGAAAARLIGLADDLTGRFTATWEALRKGRIDVAGAHAITEGLQHVEDEELARAVESAVLAETPGRTSSRLRRRVRDLLIKIDPEAAARRRTTAEKGRRVELYDNPSGTCDLVGRDLPADRAHGIFNKLRAAAKALKDDGDPRPIDAIRADLLLALCAGLPWPQAAHQIARDPNTGGDDVHVADVGKVWRHGNRPRACPDGRRRTCGRAWLVGAADRGDVGGGH